MLTTVTQAIHLVSSDSAAGHVKHIGVPRNHVRILGERLTIGPCDVDPERHVALRRAWDAEALSETFGFADLRAAVTDELPVVVWATRAYADLIWLWWILDGLGRLGQLAQPPILVRPKPDDPLSTVGGSTPENGLAALANAHSMQDAELREATELWRMYASSDPLAFDEARRRGSPVFPEFRESAELHGVWFPRIEGARLRLAEHDERLLASLTDGWLTTHQLLGTIVKTHGWQRLLWPFGGFAPVWRIRAWAAQGAVAQEAHDNENPFEQDVFRLTDRTRALLANGLEGVGDAPPLYVGGCRLNDPASPWVRVTDDSGWRIIAHT